MIAKIITVCKSHINKSLQNKVIYSSGDSLGKYRRETLIFYVAKYGIAFCPLILTIDIVNRNVTYLWLSYILSNWNRIHFCLEFFSSISFMVTHSRTNMLFEIRNSIKYFSSINLYIKMQWKHVLLNKKIRSLTSIWRTRFPLGYSSN